MLEYTLPALASEHIATGLIGIKEGGNTIWSQIQRATVFAPGETLRSPMDRFYYEISGFPPDMAQTMRVRLIDYPGKKRVHYTSITDIHITGGEHIARVSYVGRYSEPSFRVSVEWLPLGQDGFIISADWQNEKFGRNFHPTLCGHHWVNYEGQRGLWKLEHDLEQYSSIPVTHFEHNDGIFAFQVHLPKGKAHEPSALNFILPKTIMVNAPTGRR